VKRRPDPAAFRPTGELRIIGGQWRSRRLDFAAAAGLRPTPDRVRETLFNWLGQDLTGLRCLDLFAGSGALGFEAASRGAARVVLVERSGAVCRGLRANCKRLEARQVQVVEADGPRFLEGPVEAFDVVFLDPPFRCGLLAPACAALERRGWLAAAAWIYLESEAAAALEALPETWHILRAKQTGDLAYRLCRRAPPFPAASP
jgi:16S rRNA (guanine966-N2)-methyltransferase